MSNHGLLFSANQLHHANQVTGWLSFINQHRGKTMATAWLFQRTKGKGQAWSVGWRDHDKKKREKKIGF